MGKPFFVLTVILLSLTFSCKERTNHVAMNVLENEKALEQVIKTASEDYIKAWSDNDLDLMKSLTVDHMTREANGEITSVNQEQLAETMEFWHTAMPDLNIASNQIIVKGNKAYASWASSGTNTGMFGETPPTGKKSATKGFTVLTFDDDGQIIHEQAFYDLLGVVQAWGYSVAPPIME